MLRRDILRGAAAVDVPAAERTHVRRGQRRAPPRRFFSLACSAYHTRLYTAITVFLQFITDYDDDDDRGVGCSVIFLVIIYINILL